MANDKTTGQRTSRSTAAVSPRPTERKSVEQRAEEQKAEQQKAERKSSSRKSSKKELSMEVGSHGFAPGTEVGVYPDSDVGPERNTGREPIPKALSTSKVGKDGKLEVSAKEPGAYSLAGKNEKTGEWRYVTVTLKEDD